MKRVKVKFLMAEEVPAVQVQAWLKEYAKEIEQYEEAKLRDRDVLDEHSFEVLFESVLEFANGLWKAAKGFWGMAKWSIILMVEGLVWLWKHGIGKKKEKVKDGNTR